jgi:exopolysaccharide biosynthesis polyprenyl glycosylphosphotransferase
VSWGDSVVSVRTRREQGVKVAASMARALMRWSTGVWGVLDVAAGIFGFILAHHLSPRYSFAIPGQYSVQIAAAIFAILLVGLCYAQGLYDRHNLASYGFIIRATVVASVLALASTSVGFGWFRFVRIGRVVLFNTFLITGGAIILIRILARALARWAKVRVLFVGPRGEFRLLHRALRQRFRGFYHRPVYFRPSGETIGERRAELLETLRKHDPDEIVIAEEDGGISEVLYHSPAILKFGCEIRTLNAYFEEMLGEVPIEAMDDRAILGNGLKNNRYGTNLTKRLLDVSLAAFGLVIGAPVMAFVACLVRLTSTGRILYTQERVGRYGKTFTIYKFRTMRTDAEKNGAMWASGRDSRTTSVGRFLRLSRLDELPQLWNILRGDMSFVGPRPERPMFVEKLQKQIPYYGLRHLVPPGLTGWAQVRYRYGASVQDARRKLAFDLYYVRHYGPAFDLAICLRTAVAMAKGAR